VHPRGAFASSRYAVGPSTARRDGYSARQVERKIPRNKKKKKQDPSLTLASSLSPYPPQVNPVYTICHEDRAFLCRGCDVSLHSANEAVKKHRRFLYTGVTVALAPLGEKETATPREATDIVKEVPPMAAPIRPTVTQPQPQKKRKAVDIEDDFAVPTMSPDNSAGHGGVQWQSDEEFNSFVQDFVGKGEKNPDVNFDGFLDNFFDDVPLSDDFGVVPTM
jgi:hypothetical protein